MKKKVKFIFVFITTLIILTTGMTLSASAHSLTPWANLYTKSKAGGDYHFAIADVYHVDGNTVNYYWANTITKNYFSNAMAYGVGLWNGMIFAAETEPSNAHMKVTYNPNIGADMLAYVVTWTPSNGHYAPGGINTEMVLGNIASNPQKHKNEIIRHELGHVWGLEDLYDVNTTLESIYSQGDKYDYPTRHDKNAMRICLNSPWFYNSNGTRKYQKSPGVWAKNETLKINNDYFKFDSNGLLQYMNIENGIYEIQGKTSGKLIRYEVSNNSAVIHTSEVTNSQKFKFERQSDSTYKITQLSNNKVLDSVDNFSGTNMKFSTWNGGNNQKWYIVDCGNGWVKFINKYSGLVLDVEGDETENGTPIQQWEDADVSAQRFKLIKKNIPNHTNVGAKGFSTVGNWFETSTNDRVWPADVNGDGKTDLVGITFDGSVEYALSRGSKSYDNAIISSSNVFKTEYDWFNINSRQRVFPADVNGDGYDDFVGVAIDGKIYVSINNKNNTYSASTYISGGGFTSSWFSTSYQQRVWPADVDGDGKTDIVGISNSGDVYWSRSKGDGSFENTSIIGSNVFPTSGDWFSIKYRQRVWPADVNGDGKDDFVGISANGRIYVSLNNGNNKFSSSTLKDSYSFSNAGKWFETSERNRVWPADLNGDGKIDLVGIGSDGILYCSYSKGNGEFENLKPIDTFIFPTSGDWFAINDKQRVWPSDVNGDGKSDFIGVSINGYIFTAEKLT